MSENESDTSLLNGHRVMNRSYKWCGPVIFSVMACVFYSRCEISGKTYWLQQFSKMPRMRLRKSVSAVRNIHTPPPVRQHDITLHLNIAEIKLLAAELAGHSKSIPFS